MERALWFVRPGEVELRREPAASDAPPAGELDAVGLASGISQGTELLLYRGEGTTPFDPSLDAPGQPTYPRRYGYAWVGEVTRAGEGVSIPVGTRIFALAPHGDRRRFRSDQVRVLSKGVPVARATLAANLETAVTALWDSGVTLGDRVIICGAGIVGLLVTRLAVRAGAQHVIVIEPSEKRRQAALAMGASLALPPDHGRELGLADVVFEMSGKPECLSRCFDYCGDQGHVVVVSNYGSRAAPVMLGGVFHRRRLRLISSQVSALPAGRQPRWDHARRFDVVRSLLTDTTLDELIEPALPFAAAPEVYRRLAERGADALHVLFQYGA
ncbi:MAG: zinc-binding alcohol dehydrogenase [Deltaproteobacteria bacterium]|nr:zinc-binding alcohol dehydrogenase [Deltaproteobacteria bacterium]